MLPHPSLLPASQLPLERTSAHTASIWTIHAKRSPPPTHQGPWLSHVCSVPFPYKVWFPRQGVDILGTIVLSHPLTAACVLSQDRTCLWTKPGMGYGPAPQGLESNIVSDFKVKPSAM